MDNFDGRKWVQRQTRMGGPATIPQQADVLIDYEITLEPHGQNWLLALETPVNWDVRNASLSSLGQLLRVAPVDQRISYRGTSLLEPGQGRHRETADPGMESQPARRHESAHQATGPSTAGSDRR